MKIAVASEEDSMVAGHFGHCPSFNIYEEDGGKVVDRKIIPNPGHRPGFLPKYLHDLGVDVIISGGMGGGAIQLFNDRGIEVITGASGQSDAVVEQYLAGTLVSSGVICHEHQHHDECEN
jgi:predicted Fe-Mo cluster-binding NifX family protein